MNPAWPSVLLLLAAGAIQADDADKLRALGGGVFTKDGVVAEINLNLSKITDEQLELVAGFGHLTDLSLEQTKIGDKGLAHLAGLAKLEWLNLYRTQVGDAGLEHLAKLPRLQPNSSRMGGNSKENAVREFTPMPNVTKAIAMTTQP